MPLPPHSSGENRIDRSTRGLIASRCALAIHAMLLVLILGVWSRSYGVAEIFYWSNLESWDMPSRSFGLGSGDGSLQLAFTMGKGTAGRMAGHWRVNYQRESDRQLFPRDAGFQRGEYFQFSGFAWGFRSGNIPRIQTRYVQAELFIPFWIVFFAFAALTVRAFLRYRRLVHAARFKLEGRCGSCGYDLRASPYSCPECGTIRDSQAREIKVGKSKGTRTIDSVAKVRVPFDFAVNLSRSVDSTDSSTLGGYSPSIFVGLSVPGWTGGDFNYDNLVTAADAALASLATNILAAIINPAPGTTASVDSSAAGCTSNTTRQILTVGPGGTNGSAYTLSIQLSGTTANNANITVHYEGGPATMNGVTVGLTQNGGTWSPSGTTGGAGDTSGQFFVPHDCPAGTYSFSVQDSSGRNLGIFSIVVTN